jgi:hypothetical protein
VNKENEGLNQEKLLDLPKNAAHIFFGWLKPKKYKCDQHQVGFKRSKIGIQQPKMIYITKTVLNHTAHGPWILTLPT